MSFRFGRNAQGTKIRGGVDPVTRFRRRLIAETELAILIGLTFPERVPRIPRVEAGTSSFTPRYAAQFWAEALGLGVQELRALDASLAALHSGEPS